MNEERKTKPLVVELADAKVAFAQLLNTLQQNGLSCYLIEMALSDIITQLHNGAMAELATARQQIAKEGHNHENCGCGCEQ